MITKSNAILVLNAGSSSLKFSLYSEDVVALNLLARGLYDSLGIAPRFTATGSDGTALPGQIESPPSAFGHAEAFQHLAKWLHEQFGCRLSLAAVGHRMTHGGSEYTQPTLMTPGVLGGLEQLVHLAPLHLPHNLEGVRAVQQLHPQLPQVACFDTAFHRNRALVTERFGLPRSFFDEGVKRWGFHGLSYQSIAGQFGRLAPNVASGRVIVAHLGSGASLCAMKAGRSVDTTMSFSPLDGLPMSTRCGSLDPGVILHLLRSRSAEQIQNLLYNQSGLLGMSGIAGDMRTLLASGDPLAAEAVDFYVYRIIREIGSLTAALEGLDALIFTAGVGENSPIIRERVCRGLAWLGVVLDARANAQNEKCISLPGRSPSVWVLATDEESVIAAQTWEIVSRLPAPIRASSASRRDRTTGPPFEHLEMRSFQ